MTCRFYKLRFWFYRQRMQKKLHNLYMYFNKLIFSRITFYKKVTLRFNSMGDSYYIKVDGPMSHNVRMLRNGKPVKRVENMKFIFEACELSSMNYTIHAGK